jgi:hypothetical protein
MMRGLSFCNPQKTLREEQLGEKIAWIDDDGGGDDDGIGVDGEWSKAGGRSSLA